MKLKPLEASLFKPLPDTLKQQLIRSGVVPVNDIFLPVWDNRSPIILLYGSYGSGKSVFIVDKLIDKAINNEYFRCYFGRKIFDTVRGTVFKTITDRIKELHKEHLFTFSDAPNGSMVIRCKKTGNEFNPFGANDPSSLKSIKDPTDFFCEELDQFTFVDFGLIYSRLRTEKAETQFYGAFNTERVYQSHWIRKILFDGEFSGQAFKLKSTYADNQFIDQEEYYNKLRLISGGNAATLNAIANGEWGMVRTGGEFWKSFDETKHVKPVHYIPGAVWLSLDDNVNPYVTVTGWQIRGTSINQIKELLCRHPDNNAPRAASLTADWLRSIGHTDIVMVCGDPSASKRTTVDINSSSFYDKFIQELKERGFRVTNKVMKSAPEVALSGAFVNAIYAQNLYGWTINIGDRCFESIEDYMLVLEDAEGKMAKIKTKDPETHINYELRGHISDTKRYIVLTVMDKEFNDYKGGKTNLKGMAGYFR
jgi:phage terminase large subunit